jgi:hypothetical protein
MTTTTTREFFYSPKGGQGCSTTAALRALKLSETGKDVLLLVDHDQFPTMCAILNTHVEPGRLGADVSPHLTVMPTDTRWLDRDDRDGIDEVLFDHIIVDGGVAKGHVNLTGAYERIMVLRNCYLAMRLVNQAPTPDRAVLILEPNRALDAQDVGQVLHGAPVTVLPLDPAISRAVDAGLLTARPPKAARVLA